MISFSEAIAQCAEHIAKDDNHGYSQPNRKGYGSETLAFSDGTTYTIHRGDYDCSEMARMCVEAAGLLPSDSYMWTGNEYEVLTDAGFCVVPLSERCRGDILWKPGHTGIYLGENLIADAHGDEKGGITGPAQGDQTGSEIEIRSYWSCTWQMCFRAPTGHLSGSQTVKDITRGIDISNNNGNISLHDIDCGFVIAKASEGNYFTDTYCKDFLKQASENGMLYGMYHYANTNKAVEEAEFFVECAKNTGYLDGATLWLDYEGEALEKGPIWAEVFMQRVDDLTGKTCGIYMSQNTCITQDWTNSAHRPLWVAQYADMDTTSWQDNPWSTWMFGAWGNKCAILQYTGTGNINGKWLDLDKGYFTKEDWASWATGTMLEPDYNTGDGGYFEMKQATVTFNETMNIRRAPSTHSNIVGQYHAGESVIIDGLTIAGGYVWGHYIGSTSGLDCYVALGKTDYID